MTDIVWVVSELVENSVRHTPTDQIWVDLCLGDDRVAVQVLDQGSGLPSLPQALAEPTYRHGLDMIRHFGAFVTSADHGDRRGVNATWTLPTSSPG